MATPWLGWPTFVLIAISAGLLAAQTRVPSPDKEFHAVKEEGQRIGRDFKIEWSGHVVDVALSSERNPYVDIRQ
jgi:hypothetical protein